MARISKDAAKTKKFGIVMRESQSPQSPFPGAHRLIGEHTSRQCLNIGAQLSRRLNEEVRAQFFPQSPGPLDGTIAARMRHENRSGHACLILVQIATKKSMPCLTSKRNPAPLLRVNSKRT
jgi:hypothetical protein